MEIGSDGGYDAATRPSRPRLVRLFPHPQRLLPGDRRMSTASSQDAIAPNAYRLLWAGFMAILAAGVGFAIRGGILDNWGREFGFTGS